MAGGPEAAARVVFCGLVLAVLYSAVTQGLTPELLFVFGFLTISGFAFFAPERAQRRVAAAFRRLGQGIPVGDLALVLLGVGVVVALRVVVSALAQLVPGTSSRPRCDLWTFPEFSRVPLDCVLLDPPLSADLAGAVLLVIGLTLIGRRWVRAGRAPRLDHPIVAEYGPPEGMRPAELGVLMAERLERRHITATIVDLALRGVLRLETDQAGSEAAPARGLPLDIVSAALGRDSAETERGDMILVLVRADDPTLEPFERRLIQGLAEIGQRIPVRQIRDRLEGTLEVCAATLSDSLVSKGWFVASPQGVRDGWRRKGQSLIGLEIVGALILSTNGQPALAFFLLPVWAALCVLGLVLILAASAMPARTPKGQELLLRVRGFRRYMETVETERQRFADRERILRTYMPYAIVFGLPSTWTRGLADLDMGQPFKERPVWGPIRIGDIRPDEDLQQRTERFWRETEARQRGKRMSH